MRKNQVPIGAVSLHVQFQAENKSRQYQIPGAKQKIFFLFKLQEYCLNHLFTELVQRGKSLNKGYLERTLTD